MKAKNIFFYIFFIGLILFVIIALYQYQKEKGEIPSGFTFVNGRLEGNTITIATKIAGRLETINFEEGQEIKSKEVLAHISSKELQAKLKAAEAAIKEAQASIKEIQALKEEAQALWEQNQRDLQRFKQLYKKKLIPKVKLEQAQLLYTQSAAKVKSLDKRLEALKASIQRLKAQREEILALLEDTQIRAPSDGVIIRQVANLGEVLSPGTTIALMVNLDKLYLKAYVPEKEIGRVALGQEARIFVDAYPHRYFKGRVGYISSKAEFTPKEVQTKEARVKQVYAIKIFLDQNPQHRLTPGIPADALIKIEKGKPWPKHFP